MNTHRRIWNTGSTVAVAVLGIIAIAPSCRGALIEYLPFDGNADATVGTSGSLNSADSTPPTFVADQNGSPNSAIAFDGSATDKQNVQVSDGGGLAGLSTGTIVMDVRWVGSQAGGKGFSTGTVLARQGNGAYSNDGQDPVSADRLLQQLGHQCRLTRRRGLASARDHLRRNQ